MLSIPVCSSRLLITGLMVSGLTLTGCSKSNEQPTTPNPTEKISPAQPDTDILNYTVATVQELKPFILRDENAQLDGFDIDILKAVANDQNFTLTFATVPAEEKLNSVTQNKFDMLLSAVSITKDRQDIMKFSDPYFVSRQAVVAKANTPAITSFNDLKDAQVAVKPLTTSDKILKNITNNPNNISYVDTAFQGIEQVIQGKAKYAMSDEPVLNYYASNLKDINLKVYTDDTYEPEKYAIAFSKDRNDDLIQKVNLGLRNIKQDGTYQTIEKKWFGQ